MSHLPTYERFEVIERRLEDHEARLEEVEDDAGLLDGEPKEEYSGHGGFNEIDEKIDETDGVYVHEDISVSDGFEDVRQWVPDHEGVAPPTRDVTRVTGVNGIELYHDEDGDFVITTDGIKRGNEDGIYVDKADLITLAEIVAFEKQERFE